MSKKKKKSEEKLSLKAVVTGRESDANEPIATEANPQTEIEDKPPMLPSEYMASKTVNVTLKKEGDQVVTITEDSTDEPQEAEDYTVEELVAHDVKPEVKEKPKQSNIWQIWEEQLQQYGGKQSLLFFESNPEKYIDLTNADSSGLAQLLGGRKTRLSHLLRERTPFRQGLITANALLRKMYELAAEQGIDSAFMACGLVSAKGRDGKEIHAPLLLSRIQFEPREGEEDYDVQISRSVGINPALVRWFWTNYRIDLTTLGLEELANAGFRLEVLPTLDRVKAVSSTHVDVKTEIGYYIGTFADLEIVHPQDVIDPKKTLLAALAGEDDALEVYKDKDNFKPVVQLDDREPEKEFLLLDADAEQQAVIDAAGEGQNVTVRTPPGSGATQTAVNVLGTLVSLGKRVLVVAERRAEISDVLDKLKELHLDHLVLDVSQAPDVKPQLINSLLCHEKAEPKDVAELYETLNSQRAQLKQHVESLHELRPEWRCSALDAMKKLAAMNQLPIPPQTQVRLDRATLSKTLDRTTTRKMFDEIAQLGYFQDGTHHSQWYRADIHNKKDVEIAKKLAQGLAYKDFPELVQQMTAIAKYSNIRLARTPQGWGHQLKVLISVQESLDTFQPDIFGVELSEMIAATAPASWRRAEDVQIGAIARNRLKKQAKSLILEETSIPVDLHEALISVQGQSQLWDEFAVDDSLPRVHQNTQLVYNNYLEVMDKLSQLSQYLETTYAGGSLSKMRYQDLQSRLNSLADDETVLENLPRTNALDERLTDRGFKDLLEDCIARRVPTSQLPQEIELAWWQSVLEEMIKTEKDSINLADGPSLRKLQAEYRLNDKAHIASCAQRLAYHMKEGWDEAVQVHPHQANELRELLRAYAAPLLHVWQVAPDLLNFLTPIWIASPASINDIPRGVRFDTVMILNAAKTNVVSVLPAISRASQVIAFGDDSLAGPQPFTVEISQEPLRYGAGQDSRSALEALDAVSVPLKLRTMYRTADEKLVEFLREQDYYSDVKRLPLASTLLGIEPGLSVQYVAKNTGMANGVDGSVESVDGEVDHVIQMILQHVRRKPEESLAVITASKLHADRLTDAYIAAMGQYPELAVFNKRHNHVEPFVALEIEQAYGVIRENIIFSLGYGQTPHGRVIHNFGPLSEADGKDLFIQALTRGQKTLTFVSCFKAEDLDEARLKYGAKGVYELLKFAEEHGLTANYGQKLMLKQPEVTSGTPDSSDPLTQDLVSRLENRGVRTQQKYGQEVDVAAYSSGLVQGRKLKDTFGEDVRPLAIESDGTAKYRYMSVRERNRIRPQMFETYGWRYMPLWSTEVFTNPDLCAVSIDSYLQGATDETPAPELEEDTTNSDDAHSKGIDEEKESELERLSSSSEETGNQEA
ncbi:MAG: hypothetical protein QM632_06750 [Micrococcaceae bacterium]